MWKGDIRRHSTVADDNTSAPPRGVYGHPGPMLSDLRKPAFTVAACGAPMPAPPFIACDTLPYGDLTTFVVRVQIGDEAPTRRRRRRVVIVNVVSRFLHSAQSRQGWRERRG